MEEKLIQRLEAAVARLEAVSAARGTALADASRDLDTSASDPAILAFDDLMTQYVGRVYGAAEKIGGQVLDVTKILHEAFSAQKELLIKIKQTQVVFEIFYFVDLYYSRRWATSWCLFLLMELPFSFSQDCSL